MNSLQFLYIIFAVLLKFEKITEQLLCTQQQQQQLLLLLLLPPPSSILLFV